MADVIGAVRVVLGADIAAFEDGLKGASKKFDQFGKDLKIAGAAFATALAASFVALGVAVKRTIDEADKLGKMAQSFGVPVDELSRLKHAADLSDVSLEALGKSLGILSKNMSAAAQGTGPAADAFRTLGISVTAASGGLKSSNQIMEEVADRFGKMQDGAGKTAIAMAIFGRTGASLIPMLNQGGDALRQMNEEADKLGIVISERTAKAAEDFNDNLTRLGKVKDGIVIKITEAMLPALQTLAQHFIEVAKESDLATKIGDTLAVWMLNIAALAIRVNVGIERFSANLAVLADVIRKVASGDFSAALEAYRAGGEATAAAFVRANAAVSALFEKFATVPIGQSGWGDAADQSDKAVARLIQNGAKVDSVLEKFRGWSEGLEKEHAAIMQRFSTPVEALQIELDKLQAAFLLGIINQEEFAKAAERAAERAGATWGIAGEKIAGSFAEIANAFGKESSSMATAGKIFGIIQATISMFTGAAKALELPFPANLAAMAAVLAKGAVLVASIKSTNVPGFAGGGSFKVGGVGGPDSQMIGMRLTPGEMVDVKKGDTRSRTTELVIPSIRPRDFFTGETVREMVMAIDRWSRDGGTGIRFAT